MSADLHTAAKCFGLFIEDKCVAFIGIRHFPHPHVSDIMNVQRLVVLPDYQGLGIGPKFMEWMGEFLALHGYRAHSITAQPVLKNSYRASPRWQRSKSVNVFAGKTATITKFDVRRMNTESFEYRPLAREREARDWLTIEKPQLAPHCDWSRTHGSRKDPGDRPHR